jgi:hypothetical protein
VPLKNPCPDCGLAEDPGPDGECATCRDGWYASQRDKALYGAGYEDAMSQQRPDPLA